MIFLISLKKNLSLLVIFSEEFIARIEYNNIQKRYRSSFSIIYLIFLWILSLWLFILFSTFFAIYVNYTNDSCVFNDFYSTRNRSWISIFIYHQWRQREQWKIDFIRQLTRLKESHIDRTTHSMLEEVEKGVYHLQYSFRDVRFSFW